MTGLHFHPLRVASVHREAEDALLISFDLPANLQDLFCFAPGQYLTLKRPGEEVRRSYSICAVPGEALRVGVRHLPGGAFSSWLHASLHAGDTLDVMPPQGRFGAAVSAALTAASDGRHHLMAVAGGSGITPLLSIIKSVLTQEPGSRVSLLYGNRSAASTMFKEELEDLKNRYLTRFVMHPVFSRLGLDTPLNSGRLDGAKLNTLLRLTGLPDDVFICGPHAMNDEAEATLLAAGVAPGHIHVERFGVPPSVADANLHTPRAGDAASARIVIVRDGLTREIDFLPGDENILAAAARAGIEVPYSCRSGVCATCRARLLEGQVRMDRNFALEPSEVAAGFVLTCQAHPLSEHVRVSFDER